MTNGPSALEAGRFSAQKPRVLQTGGDDPKHSFYARGTIKSALILQPPKMPVGMTAFLVRSWSVLRLILSDSGVCCGKVVGGEKTLTEPFYTSFLPSCRFFLPLQLPCRASDRPCHEFLRATVKCRREWPLRSLPAALIFISLAIDKRFRCIRSRVCSG